MLTAALLEVAGGRVDAAHARLNDVIQATSGDFQRIFGEALLAPPVSPYSRNV